uniref:Kinesin motor domain-containing protein n=1 Tax=Setaria digitata TaxID=48799 RepID=A0A915Q7B7_9BILA
MEADVVEDSIKVVVRMRPPLPRELAAESYWKVIDDNTIVDGESKSYIFDRVYRQVDRTKDVYDNSAKEVVESAMAGYNGTLFAYGQTASGKTYTMFGTENVEGIVQMALDTIFAKILEGSGRRYMLRMSCIEIYNEKVRDLLSDSIADLPVKEFKEKTVVDGLREEVIVGKDGVEILIQRAFGTSCLFANRVIGETALNERSSRSHVILRFIIECYDDDVTSVSSSYISFLNVVDLAGSESAKQSGGDGDRLKESGKINTSLLALQKVINQLSEKGHCHVNFRDSKLTRLLKSSLGGNARTLIICTASPTEVMQTLQTLRFAVRAKKIKNKPRKNWNAEGMLTQYIQTIERLKTQLEENRKNETVELELMNKNIELSKEVERLRKCILSSQMLPQPAQNHIDRRARRQTWGGNWARPDPDVILPCRNSDPNVRLYESPIPKRSKICAIDEMSEQPDTTVLLDTSLDGGEEDIPADLKASKQGSNDVSGSVSTVTEIVDDIDDHKSSVVNGSVEDEKISVGNSMLDNMQRINEDESPSCSEKDAEGLQWNPINKLKKKVAGLEDMVAELKAENENLKEELRCRDRDIGWLEKHCDDADNKETELREQIYETQKKNDENLLVIAGLRDEITQMKDSMMAYNDADMQNKENLFNLENEIRKMEKETRELKGEIASKDRKINGLLLELRRVTSRQENNAEKARFGSDDNLPSKEINCIKAESNRKKRYAVEIDPSRSTPIKNYPECKTQ